MCEDNSCDLIFEKGHLLVIPPFCTGSQRNSVSKKFNIHVIALAGYQIALTSTIIIIIILLFVKATVKEIY